MQRELFEISFLGSKHSLQRFPVLVVSIHELQKLSDKQVRHC